MKQQQLLLDIRCLEKLMAERLSTQFIVPGKGTKYRQYQSTAGKGSFEHLLKCSEDMHNNLWKVDFEEEQIELATLNLFGIKAWPGGTLSDIEKARVDKYMQGENVLARQQHLQQMMDTAYAEFHVRVAEILEDCSEDLKQQLKNDKDMSMLDILKQKQALVMQRNMEFIQ